MLTVATGTDSAAGANIEALQETSADEVYNLHTDRYLKSQKLDQPTGIPDNAVINLPEVTDNLQAMSNCLRWERNVQGILLASRGCLRQNYPTSSLTFHPTLHQYNNSSLIGSTFFSVHTEIERPA